MQYEYTFEVKCRLLNEIGYFVYVSDKKNGSSRYALVTGDTPHNLQEIHFGVVEGGCSLHGFVFFLGGVSEVFRNDPTKKTLLETILKVVSEQEERYD